MNQALKWIIPGGVTLAGGVALALWAGTGAETAAVSSVITWALCGAAVVLAWVFRRSRVAAVAVGLFALERIVSTQAGGFTAVYFFAGLLVVSVGILVLFQDHGVWCSRGLFQVGGVVALGLAGGVWIWIAPGGVAGLLAAMPLPARLTLWTGLPQPVFFLFLLALASTIYMARMRDGAVERGMVWFLVALASGLYLSNHLGSLAVVFLAGALILTFSVLETSYLTRFEDDLTGLPARRALLRDFQDLKGRYSIAIVDVDDFKHFNDRFGHDVGDQVLRMVASHLRRLHGGARAYRLAGEEFTLLFRGKGLEDSVPVLRAIRKSIEEATFILRGWRRPLKKPVDPAPRKASTLQRRRLSVTVCIGAAESGGGETDPATILKRADEALYRAMAAGRNRLAVWGQKVVSAGGASAAGAPGTPRHAPKPSGTREDR